MRETLTRLHDLATNARDEAYEVALRNRQADGDSYPAFLALLKANEVRDAIYLALLANIGTIS